MGRFKAPSLRNVAITAPYMHDGSIATLDEVLDH
jgi:cytochrome c peroxidase